MVMTYARPELELKRRAPMAGGVPGTHEFVRAATVVVGFRDTCDFICSGAADQVEGNAAIVYVNGLGGGDVYFEQGNYVLTGSILPLTNVFLHGAGPDTVFNGQALAHAIDINGQDYVTLRDFSCQTTAGGGAAVNAVNIRGGSSDIRIFQIYVLQSDQDGVAITSADSEVYVTEVTLTTIDRYPVNCDGDNCKIKDCEISGAVGNDGIFLDVNSDGCCVICNHVHSWTGEPIDNDGDNLIQFNVCTPIGNPVVAWNAKGCGFDDVQEAIDHQAGSGFVNIVAGTHTVAAGVIALDAADSGLKVYGQGRLVTILTSSAASCITINAAINITISDLSFRTTGVGVAADGIAVTGACTGIFLENLACLDCDQDAISIAATVSEVIIRSCYLFGGIDRHGINLAGDNCQVRGNRITGVGSDGIWIQANAIHNVVCLNVINNAGGEAIDNDEPNNTVAHNETW